MHYLGNEGREKLTTSFHTDMTFLSVKRKKKRNGHFSNQGKAMWKQKVLMISRDYFCTGFFFSVDILYEYPKGNLHLIYLVIIMGFEIINPVGVGFLSEKPV